MKSYNVHEKLNNRILPLLAVIAVFLVGGIYFDFYYDLNDDVVIKDIISGAYTGVPEGHTNQMLYPVAWMLSMVYRVFAGAPVFGVFLCFCFGLCFYLIGYRSLQYFRRMRTKLIVLAMETVLVLAVFLWELVYVQYSVVCGLLAATACFVFFTTPNELEIKEFWKANIVTVLLVVLAFWIRSEMLLLMCPFFAAVGIYHWSEEVRLQEEKKNGPERFNTWQKIFRKENCFRYIGFILVILAGMGLGLLADRLAFQGAQWKEFREFFNARTEVYDYTWYPDYEENQEYYDGIGVSQVQYQLIDNYNFGLDENISADTLERIAAYGEKQQNMGSQAERVKNTVWELGYRIISPADAPYNYFVLAAYLLVIILAVLQKDKSYVWKLILLGVMRSISWIYLIWVQRVVPRVSHPLYIIEFIILLAFLVKALHDRPLWNVEQYYRYAVAGVLGIMAVVSIPHMYGKVQAEQIRRETVNEKARAFDAYAKEHLDNYYYLDVYSTVDFSEKMYEDVDNRQKNYDILGGWICNSPLQEQARQTYLEGENLSIKDALLEENFFFVVEEQGDTSFIVEFYEQQGILIKLELQDTVGEGENPLLVYKLVNAGEKG